ncbi:phosphatidylinositol transfer protein 3-like isoform X3 [Lolium rigidum]|nr:phosphatidylinositol transfer protein 3-like isoform X3 [Lolium rigidum]
MHRTLTTYPCHLRSRPTMYITSLHSEAMSFLLKKTSSDATQPKSLSSEEQQEKVNEVRGLLGALTEEMPSFLSDTTIYRFLLARNWSTEQAAKGLKETVKWRHEYRPEAISWEDIAEKEDEAKRIHVANCVDKNGRSVLILNMSIKSKVSLKDQIKHMVYLLEHLVMSSADEKDDYGVWIIDVRGWSIASTPFSTTRECLHIIQTYYPGLIAVAIIFDPPRIFESFWKITKSLLDANMRDKVEFLYASKPDSMKTMEELFDKDTLEASSFGGRSTSATFDINKYAERMRGADKMRGESRNANGCN